MIRFLHGRTTSKPEDETIAIAGLVGVSVASLLAESDASARMRVFLRELRTLPASMLVSSYPRQSVPGFRWAPLSLTSPINLGQREGIAHCTSEGLTTEREFGLMLFPAVQLGGSDPLSEALALRNPTSGATYLALGLGKKAEGRTMVMNGLVTAPKAFPSGTVTSQEGSTTKAVAVYIAAPPGPSDSGYEENVQEQPVVCEYLFYTEFQQFRSIPGLGTTEGQPTFYYAENRKVQAPMIQGRFKSARITMT